jgi:hypothetical protein
MQKPALSDLILFLQTPNMGQQFIFVGHAGKVPANHLIGSQCRLSAGPKTDQYAGDNRRIDLQFDTIFVLTEQMTTTQHMLEESEKDFDGPANRRGL